MNKWQKILYKQQDFPDNYSGGQEQFLRELRKNVSAVQYKYFDAVVACCNLIFHVNCVILFYVVYKKVEDGLLHEETLLLSSYTSLLIFYTIYSLMLAKGDVNFSDHLFTTVTLNFYGFGLTPIIRTLTTTISTDTVYATSIFTAVISCVFHDYGVKAPIVSMPLSASSGLCSAIFLLSRLKSNFSAFALLSSAFALHACSPVFRKTMNYKPNDGPPSKRVRPTYVDVETPPEFFNISSTPSKVIHIADLSPKAQDPDLLEAFARFGRVSYIVIKRQPKNVALLEYEAIDGASSAMLYVQTTPIYVCSQRININFSALEKIPRFGFETDQPNKVLVLLVTNVQFNVNASTLYDICKPHGTVLRIAIVKRTPNITALVEFESMESARNCKFGINGADIYTNCCTLKVEYAKIPNVRILYPDEDHMDFTQPLPGESQPNRKTLMAAPTEYVDIRQMNSPGDVYTEYRCGYGSVHKDPHFYEPYREARPMYRDYLNNSGGYEHPHSSRYDDRRELYADPRQGRLSSDCDLMRGGAGCVLIIGGMDQTKMNCDRLFNLLCIYGNVLRVMFMKKKTELALVEMGNSWQAREAIHNLRRIEFLGMEVEISLSNQNCVNPIQEPFTLPDGSISYKDFTPTKLNRYMTRDHAGKNRPCPPQPSLHWFNAPPEMNEEKLANIFKEYGATLPYSITLHRLPSGRSTAGTAEFSSIRESTEALVLANHAPVETPSSSMVSKEDAKELIAERDEIDKKLVENRLVLETNNSTMDSPLIDSEGYPIASIDVYAVRHARHNIICLENDRKALNEKLHAVLEHVHEESKSQNSGKAHDGKTVHRTSNNPFAKVSTVTSGSPSDLDGFKSGDLIIQYGDLHFDNFQSMKQLAEITANNEEKVLRVTVIRNFRPVRLEIRPRKWNGNGLLGCGITPEKSESM